MLSPLAPRSLQELGISASDIKKLTEGGIHTVESLLRTTKKELMNIKGISEAKIEKMQKEGKLGRHAFPYTLYPASLDRPRPTLDPSNLPRPPRYPYPSPSTTPTTLSPSHLPHSLSTHPYGLRGRLCHLRAAQ